MPSARLLVLLVAGTACVAGAWPMAFAQAPRWDQQAAARYLDARMDAWWANAKTLRTDGGESRCLSCHTALPYAWARPALRRSLGASTPSPHEQRIVEEVSRRLRYRDTDQPYYDHTEAKKVESRGVEAVVNAVAVAGIADEPTTSERQPLVAEALARMWAVQRADGAWDWLDFGLEPYEAPDAALVGAAMAAIAAGSPAAREAGVTEAARTGEARLRAYLRGHVGTGRAFNQVWLLLAAARLDGLIDDETRNAIVAELESRQRSDGGWSLADLGTWRWGREAAPFAPPGSTDPSLLAQSDGFATGLAVYALRRADRPLSTPAVRRGQQWLVAHQQPERAGDPAWAPWRAHSLNFDREHGGPKGEPWRRMFMSDLATAFAVLALS